MIDDIEMQGPPIQQLTVTDRMVRFFTDRWVLFWCGFLLGATAMNLRMR